MQTSISPNPTFPPPQSTDPLISSLPTYPSPTTPGSTHLSLSPLLHILSTAATTTTVTRESDGKDSVPCQMIAVCSGQFVGDTSTSNTKNDDKTKGQPSSSQSQPTSFSQTPSDVKLLLLHPMQGLIPHPSSGFQLSIYNDLVALQLQSFNVDSKSKSKVKSTIPSGVQVRSNAFCDRKGYYSLFFPPCDNDIDEIVMRTYNRGNQASVDADADTAGGSMSNVKSVVSTLVFSNMRVGCNRASPPVQDLRSSASASASADSNDNGDSELRGKGVNRSSHPKESISKAFNSDDTELTNQIINTASTNSNDSKNSGGGGGGVIQPPPFLRNASNSTTNSNSNTDTNLDNNPPYQISSSPVLLNSLDKDDYVKASSLDFLDGNFNVERVSSSYNDRRVLFNREKVVNHVDTGTNNDSGNTDDDDDGDEGDDLINDDNNVGLDIDKTSKALNTIPTPSFITRGRSNSHSALSSIFGNRERGIKVVEEEVKESVASSALNSQMKGNEKGESVGFDKKFDNFCLLTGTVNQTLSPSASASQTQNQNSSFKKNTSSSTSTSRSTSTSTDFKAQHPDPSNLCFLAVGTSLGTILIWNMSSPQTLAPPVGSYDSVYASSGNGEGGKTGLLQKELDLVSGDVDERGGKGKDRQRASTSNNSSDRTSSASASASHETDNNKQLHKPECILYHSSPHEDLQPQTLNTLPYPSTTSNSKSTTNQAIPITNIDFHPNKHHGLFISGGQGGSVKLWERRAVGGGWNYSGGSSGSGSGGGGGISGVRSEADVVRDRALGVNDAIKAAQLGIVPDYAWVCVKTFHTTPPPTTVSNANAMAMPNFNPGQPIKDTSNRQSTPITSLKWHPTNPHLFLCLLESNTLHLFHTSLPPQRSFLKFSISGSSEGRGSLAEWHPDSGTTSGISSCSRVRGGGRGAFGWSYWIATCGGGSDRQVKVWDVEKGVGNVLGQGDNISNAGAGDVNMNANANATANANTTGMREAKSSGNLNLMKHSATSIQNNRSQSKSPVPPPPPPSTASTATAITASESWSHTANYIQSTSRDSLNSVYQTQRTYQGLTNNMQQRAPERSITCVSTITTPGIVTRIRWRPPRYPGDILHGRMILIACTPTSIGGGMNGGGSGSGGVMGMWSIRRPYLPLTVVHGRGEGGVLDLCFVDSFLGLDGARSIMGDDEFEGRFAQLIESASASASITDNIGENHRMKTREKSWSMSSKETVDISVSPSSPSFLESVFNSPGKRFGPPSVAAAQLKGKVPDSPTRSGSSSIGKASDRSKTKIIQVNSNPNRNKSDNVTSVIRVSIWQHVISIGRDGVVMLHSLHRGFRPTSAVPSSTFAICPINNDNDNDNDIGNDNEGSGSGGGGSMKIAAIHSHAPNNEVDDAQLTGLIGDAITASAYDIFKEADRTEHLNELRSIRDKLEPRQRCNPTLRDVIYIDNIDSKGKGSKISTDANALTIAPELLHVKYFAQNYRTQNSPLLAYGRKESRRETCNHNADVASKVGAVKVAKMWRILGSILPQQSPPTLQRQGASAFDALYESTVREMLEDRANAGDVGSCVYVCEVIGIYKPIATTVEDDVGKGLGSIASQMSAIEQKPSSESLLSIPSIDLDYVREWYLSYIDILRTLHLSVHATALIKGCPDAYIQRITQTMTDYNSSCSNCLKPLLNLGQYDIDVGQYNPTTSKHGFGAQRKVLRACPSCRQTTGYCSICHCKVLGLNAFCVGCAHGSCISCADMWFRKMGMETCAVGCGHRCNV